jgi:hypothetical protein
MKISDETFLKLNTIMFENERVANTRSSSDCPIQILSNDKSATVGLLKSFAIRRRLHGELQSYDKDSRTPESAAEGSYPKEVIDWLDSVNTKDDLNAVHSDGNPVKLWLDSLH